MVVTDKRVLLMEGPPRVSYRTACRLWRKAVGRFLGPYSGDDLPSLHSLRHLFATEAYYSSGKDILYARDQLGHADLKSTQVYVSTRA